MSVAKAEIVENADIDRDTPQPEIHIEERRLKLLDFCKTAIKVNGSDIHLQAGSIPMIRVDGRARMELNDVPIGDDFWTARRSTAAARRAQLLSHCGSDGHAKDQQQT